VTTTIADVYNKGALAPTVDPVSLAASHVHFDQLSGRATLEKVLFDSLRSPEATRWELCGPDGAGKSSTFSRLIHDLTRLKDSNYEVLMLDVGDPSVLRGELEFAQHVIATIAGQSHRFASPVQELIELAGADELTVEAAKVTHRSKAGVDAGVAQASYAYDLTERFAKRSWGSQPARSKSDLRDIVTELKHVDRRLVVVIDDTEKFALTRDGTVDDDALTGLAAKAIPLLAVLDVDVLVATHPRFTSPAMEGARKKWLKHIEIPALSMTDNQLPLGAIVDKHLRAHEVDASWQEVFYPTVLHQLQSTYLACDRNLRHVLDLAQNAVACAHHEGVQLVDTPHLYAAQAGT
jgi:hypothetical protein